jgi:hypothetical protein
MKSKEKINKQKKDICYCNKCASPIGSKQTAYSIEELYAGEIVNILVCNDCNNEHQLQLSWSIDAQTN